MQKTGGERETEKDRGWGRQRER